jgi:hypothetical protein
MIGAYSARLRCPERNAAVGIGGEEFADVIADQGSVPVERRKLEHVLLAPIRQETEEVAKV